jgi:hypothetical protein
MAFLLLILDLNFGEFYKRRMKRGVAHARTGLETRPTFRFLQC